MNPLSNIPEPKLSLHDAHVMHFKAMITMALDASQPPCFTGEYSPRKVDECYLRTLRTHPLFSRFCVEAPHPLGDPSVKLLWLKTNYDSEYAVWRARNDEHNAQRSARWEENKRLLDAIERYYALQQKLGNLRCNRQLASDMVTNMVDAHKLGEHGFDAYLQRIGYLNASSTT